MRLLLSLITLTVIVSACQPQAEKHLKSSAQQIPSATSIHKFSDKLSIARQFIDRSEMEPSYCFFFDAGEPSSSNRFIIYDLSSDTVIGRGKAGHGRCNQYWLEGRRYSNAAGSGCTSLGKYSIGKSYYGKFGLAYKLNGLDSTNANAYRRNIVLHAHKCVPEPEDFLLQVCQSDGCPMVSPGFMKLLDSKLKRSRKPVLLWIYDDSMN